MKVIISVLVWMNISMIYSQTGNISHIQISPHRDVPGKFEVRFDLEGQKAYNISLEVSFDGGNTYAPVPETHISGDVIHISSGTDKVILWDGMACFPDKNNEEANLKIIAYESKGQPGQGVTDIDGNTYRTVIIGNQTWMAENLKATKYGDGTTIPHVTDEVAWHNLGDNNTDKAYCFYNNDESLGYGALYTYAAAVNGTPQSGNNHVQGVCPDGWHVPSDTEWTELENYLIANGYNYDGTTTGNKIAKSLASTSGWTNSGRIGDVGNNQSTNNTTGWSALPGGCHYPGDGTFGGAGIYGNWWSSSEDCSSDAYGRELSCRNPGLYRYSPYKSYGFSVRCVRD